MIRKLLLPLLATLLFFVVTESPAHAQVCGGLNANIGSATNTSNGTATLQTGNASSTGNQSSSSSSQSATGSGITNQQTQITNNGSASANTGGNRVIGNNSRNTAIVEQEITCQDYIPPQSIDSLSAAKAGKTSFHPEAGALARLDALRLRTRGVSSSRGETDTTLLPLVGVAAALVIVHLSLLRLVRRRGGLSFGY